jgi:nucleoside-diphosphate-sugar epimerase
MSDSTVIVLGGTGLIGSAVCERFQRAGSTVIAVNSRNYSSHVGVRAGLLINCNGNSYRYKANEDPRWDFEASVTSVEKSLFDFEVERYVHISTIDVYDDVSDPARNHEEASIDPSRLHPYGFHKWLAERLVERFAPEPLILRTATAIGPAVKKGPLYDLARREPLHMSPESELAFIDTATIAEVVLELVSNPPGRRIINLSGTGGARLQTLCSEFGLECRAAPGADQAVYRYNIDNARLRERFDVPTSHAMAAGMLASALKS